jgi:XTP/dITP diphosphohydrolase
MQELIFATHNKHKAIEIQALLGDNFRILSLDDAGFISEIPEDWDTLEANAVQKARFVYENLKRNCFADDTGLEVKVLGNAPGVYSARYAELSGEVKPDESIPEANIRKLLRQMEGMGDRIARFRTVIALCMNGKEYTFEGIVEGSITAEKRGEGGFGYDPVFLPGGYRQTFAEMPLHDKNKISHRAKAIWKLAEFLKNYGTG